MRVEIKHVASQSLKILLCLVILFTFMYSQPRNEVQQASAALPILAWAVPVLGSILVDTAVDMGVEFVDESSKKKWKEKKIGELWNKYGDRLKDLIPTKKNVKSWSLKAPTWLMAAVVDTITDSIEEVKKDDDDRREKNKSISYPSVDADSDDPFYNTGISILGISNSTTSGGDSVDTVRLAAYYNEWLNYSFKPIAYAQRTQLSISSDKDFSDDTTESMYIKGGTSFYVRVNFRSLSDTAFHVHADQTNINLYKIGYADTTSMDLINLGGWKDYKFVKAYPAFVKYLELLENQNKKVYYSDGVLATDGYDSYLDLPDTDENGNPIVYSPSVLQKLDDEKYPMIKEKEFEFDFGNDSDVIDADFEVINEGDEVEWEIIEKDITNNENNYNKTLNYDYEPTINNYYEVANKDDIENDINIIIKNETDIDNGGNWSGEITIEGPYYCVDNKTKLPTSCKEVEAIDGSLLDYVSNAYDYAVNAVKSGVDGIATITAGATGLIALYSNIFDWLPDQVTVILTSGLLLMIGLRVFRK